MTSKSLIPVKLKWGKNTYTEKILPGSSIDEFKERIRLLTGVPLDRQKILCKGVWKGVLRGGDGARFDENMSAPLGNPLAVTLIGSVEALPEPPEVKTKFVEDLTKEELAATKAKEEEIAFANSEGMIVPLQKAPILRNDNKTEMYQYNRLVVGLPQRQIEDTLKRQRHDKQKGSVLLGEVVMTLGLELQRAYINDLAVLPCDGTLVSGANDGHILAWRHGTCVYDVIHEGPGPGGVDQVVPFDLDDVAFATGGRGCIRMWSPDGECVGAVACPRGTSPNALAAMNLRDANDRISGGWCIASSFKVTRQTDPNQFRLPPQDDVQRQRRAEAEAHESMIQEYLAQCSRTVHVWCSTTDNPSQLQSFLLKPDANRFGATAPVTSLAVLHTNYDASSNEIRKKTLISGDDEGGLHVWNIWAAANNTNSVEAKYEQSKVLQIHPPRASASIVCMEPLEQNQLVAVSTAEIQTLAGSTRRNLPGATLMNVPTARAVFLVDFAVDTINLIIDAHKDTVQCMRSLPCGGLLTGGGKMDAKLKVWGHSQLQGTASGDNEARTNENGSVSPKALSESASELDEIGYVFALAVLPDSRKGSQQYAVAAARYNLVKICL